MRAYVFAWSLCAVGCTTNITNISVVEDAPAGHDAIGSTADAWVGDAAADVIVRPDVALPTETGHPDTETFDTSVPDAAVDVGPEAVTKSDEEVRCDRGSPRLQWMEPGGCYDTVGVIGGCLSGATTQFPCVFHNNYGSHDWACMPRLTGKVAGWESSTCTGNYAALLDVTRFGPGTDDPFIGLATEVNEAGVYAASIVSQIGVPTAGGWYAGSSCTKQAGAFSYANSQGLSVSVDCAIPTAQLAYVTWP